jgi:GNAT superfamily N-acetyltransferase
MHVYRKLMPYEIWRLEEHLLRLSPADRRLRFFSAVGDAFIAEHCRHVACSGAIVIGYFELGVLRGAAELHLGEHLGDRAELALTVESDWQAHHVGTELVDLAITIAENRGVRVIQMLCLLDNRRMQHVALKFTDRLIIEEDQTEADVRVPFPTQLSLWQEAVMDSTGLLTCWLDQFVAATTPAGGEAGVTAV